MELIVHNKLFIYNICILYIHIYIHMHFKLWGIKFILADNVKIKVSYTSNITQHP